MAEFSYLNPFSKYFLKNKPTSEQRKEFEFIKNSQGVAEDEGRAAAYKGQWSQPYEIGMPGDVYGGDIYSAPISFNEYFNYKVARISKYREMSFYPDISDALDMVADDSVIENDKGQIVSLEFTKELNSRDSRLILEEWEYLLHEVFYVRERLWDWYRKWLIDGEIFLEIVLNDSKDSVIGVKLLPAFNTFPSYTGDLITNFVQTNDQGNYSVKDENAQIIFPNDQIAYASWGVYGKSKLDVRGYLEPAVRVYNQLRNLEDAVVVYRLVRAPERRVWNIEVGKLPPGKAEEHIKKLIHKYRKQVNYDPSTGAIDSSQNVQALTEDFWFAKRDGVGSTVDPLPSGIQLGEMDDINYFLYKLRQVLKVPKDRFVDQTGGSYNSGRGIEREEVRFTKFIIRQQNKFKKLFLDVLIQQLRLKGFNDKYLDRSLYDIQWSKSNYYQEFKQQDIIESKINTWASMSGYVVSQDDPNAPFSREYVMKNMVRMSDAEWEENERLRKQEQEEAKKEIEKAQKEADANAAEVDADQPTGDKEDLEVPTQSGEAE